MKRRILYLMIITLISAGVSVHSASAQELTQEQKKEQELKKEQEIKDARLKQAIEQQKKQMTEQQKKQDEMEKALQEAEQELSRSNDAVNEFYRRSRPVIIGRDYNDPSFYVSPGVDFQYGPYMKSRGDAERTTWDFTRYVKESTFSKQYVFDVEKSAGSVLMAVSGQVKSGEIRVKIIMPGGKTYSDILIDEYGDLNWRKSFNISEEENKDKAGEWVFKIDASKATGAFKISLQTY